MTIIKFYENNNLIEKEIDKDKIIKGFVITEGHLNLNNRINNHEFEFIGSRSTKAKSFQDAVNIYKEKFDEYEKKSYDWKGHSVGCLKFYWNNGETEVLTYVKLNYKGEEVIEFDIEELGF
ncbi:hypothetical protein [Metabacillus arenae]|uniref:Uncharacterized protein n=1 Tax=Metabacillus arenae TaxID=2771434 RepID=A0A926NDM7_9BACI|nr:hypothetical protein [Metabacillus arenae]MBD1379225.1 hypothetical protein [Metabacillus arenae]